LTYTQTSFVSIIIPTFRDWKRLSLCLTALEQQSYGLENFEIIVVNNDPNDIIPETLKLPINCIYLTEGKPGSYAARNTALRQAKGSMIGFTDSDCVPDRAWILNAVDILSRDENLYRIGGAIDIFFKDPLKPLAVELYDFVFAFQQETYVNNYLTCVTGNLFTKQSVFSSIGTFDDNLLSGGDFEWGKRASTAGFKIIYSDEVIINHPARYNFSELATKSRRVAGGHFHTHEVKKGTVLFYISLIKKLIPVPKEIKAIFSNSKLTALEKCKVLVIRYRLQLIYNLALFRLKNGQQAERF
jgi:glycosyltransferase involved in cell wall biosynthesis